jgi:23S rRNA pseudouridine1911/1915/1917 synthase
MPDHSRNRIKQWIENGDITVNGKTCAPKTRVLPGAEILVNVDDTPPDESAQAQDIALNIVYEDDAILVINKPAGLTVHPGAGTPDGTLMNALLFHDPALAALPRAGIVHRLDKDTTGLMVVAKTETAHTDLVRQLSAHSVKRTYIALVWGDFEPNTAIIDAPIGRHPKDRVKMAVVSNGKPAVTHVHVNERFGYATLLTCQLETGRTHQIRVHLAGLKHPLVGDPVYGRANKPLFKNAPDTLNNFPRQALHAAQLALKPPDDHRDCAWEAPLPEDLAELLRSVDGYE